MDLSPNRTCEFPRIRLSMRDCKVTVELQEFSGPGVARNRTRHFRVEAHIVDFIVPSVRNSGASAQVFGSGPLAKSLQPHLSFTPRPAGVAFLHGVTASDFMAGRLAMLLAKPALDAVPEPPIQTHEILPCAGGILVVVAPAHDLRVEGRQKFTERLPRGLPPGLLLDAVAQQLQFPLGDQELTRQPSRPYRGFLHHPVSKEFKAFLGTGDQGFLRGQLQVQFLIEELRQRFFLPLGVLPRARYQDDEIIGITDTVEGGESLGAVPVAPCASLHAALAGAWDPSAIPFVNTGQHNVGQQW